MRSHAAWRRIRRLSLGAGRRLARPLWLVDMAPITTGRVRRRRDCLNTVLAGCGRGCSPRTYVEALQGLALRMVTRRLRACFSGPALRLRLPSLPSSLMAEFSYGIPLQFNGLNQTGSAFTSEHPELAAVLDRYFDLRPHRWSAILSPPGKRLRGCPQHGLSIIRSLIAQDCQPYALALLLPTCFP